MRGYSLISVLVATTILSIILVGVIQMFNTLFRGTQKAELRGDAVSLSRTLSQVIDCDQTWATGRAGGPIVNAVDCQDATSGIGPTALVLRDRAGNALTGALNPVTGNFDPLDNTFQGSGTMGDWAIRAYCDIQQMSLVVLAAKRGSSPNGFLPDPMTKVEWSWNHPKINPVVGSATRRLCVAQFDSSTGTCPPGRFVRAVNFNTQTVVCAPLPPPP